MHFHEWKVLHPSSKLRISYLNYIKTDLIKRKADISKYHQYIDIFFWSFFTVQDPEHIQPKHFKGLMQYYKPKASKLNLYY